jgi:hypothetical protein
MRWFAALGPMVLVAACGGKVEDSPTATITGENLPSSTQATGCEGACERFVECNTSVGDRARCVRDCNGEFPDPASAARWGSCIKALSCQRIEDGQFMNYGPLGECASRAKSGR